MNLDFKTWNFFRIFRLVLSVFAFVAFANTGVTLYAFLGVVLLIQVIFNMQCGIGGCGYPQYKKNISKQQTNINDITYEEVK